MLLNVPDPVLYYFFFFKVLRRKLHIYELIKNKEHVFFFYWNVNSDNMTVKCYFLLGSAILFMS